MTGTGKSAINQANQRQLINNNSTDRLLSAAQSRGLDSVASRSPSAAGLARVADLPAAESYSPAGAAARPTAAASARSREMALRYALN